MTVETTTCKTGPLACNGVVTTFNFDFPILAAEHLVVTKTDANDVETVLELNTDYTVTVAEYPGTGSITTLSTYATGNSITLNRDTPQTQEADIGNSGPFLAETHEDAFDKLTMLVQEQIEKLSRAILMPISSTDDPPDPAAMLAALQAATEAAQDVIDNGAVPANRTITAGAGLTGGGDLSANRTISIPNSGVTAGSYANATVTVNVRGIITAIAAGTGGGGSLGWFNVKDYGATGNGVADDTEAVQDAIDALVDAGGGVLYGPIGEYLMTTKYEVADVPFFVIGDGVGLTKWVFNTGSDDGGFHFSSSYTGDDTNSMHVFGVAKASVLTRETDGGTAISAVYANAIIIADRRFYITEVEIRGYDHGGTHTHYWTKGVYQENVVGDIHRLHIAGTHNASQTDSGCIGVHIKATSGKIPLIQNITDSIIHLYYKGLYIEGAGHMEGLHMVNSEIAETYYAVWATGGSGEVPYGLHITGGHLSAYVSCVKGYYASGWHLAGVQMQHAVVNGVAPDGNIVIMENCGVSAIVGCAFSGRYGYSPAATNENGLYLDGDSWVWTITGNVFRDIAQTGIVCTAACYNITAAGNTFHNVPTKFYTTGERCVNKDAFRGAVVYKSANQSISTGTLTALTWSSATPNSEENVSGQSIWTSGSNTRLTVPAGVTKIRLRGNTQFADPGGGGAQIAATFRKNGTDYTFAGRPAWSGNTSVGFLQQNMTSAVLSVTEGDYFELMVLQNSGGSLNIMYQDTASPGGGKQTWAEMEILETDGSGA